MTTSKMPKRPRPGRIETPGKMMPDFATFARLYNEAAAKVRANTKIRFGSATEVVRLADGGFDFIYKNIHIATLTPGNVLRIMAPTGANRPTYVYWLNKHTAGFCRPVKRNVASYIPSLLGWYGWHLRALAMSDANTRNNWERALRQVGATEDELAVLTDYSDHLNVMRNARFQQVASELSRRIDAGRSYGDPNAYYQVVIPVSNAAHQLAQAQNSDWLDEHSRLIVFDRRLAHVHLSEDVAFELDASTHLPISDGRRRELLAQLPQLKKLPKDWKDAWSRFRRVLKAAEVMGAGPFKLSPTRENFYLSPRGFNGLETFVDLVMDGVAAPKEIIDTAFHVTEQGSNWRNEERSRHPMTDALENYVRRNTAEVCRAVEGRINHQ